MRLVKQSYQILNQDFSLKGIFRAIEEAGRTCYKSVGTRYFRLEKEGLNGDLLTLVNALKSDTNAVVNEGPFFDNAYYISIKNSAINLNIESLLRHAWEESFDDCALYENLTAEDFVKNLCEHNHGAMLEHGTVYLKFRLEFPSKENYSDMIALIAFYKNNQYSKCNMVRDEDGNYTYYITTNFRVIHENDRYNDLKWLCEPEERHEKRISVKFTCSQQVSHEFVRHRKMSFGMESTRFCNYSLGKFNHELTFIEPCWLTDETYPINKENIKAIKAREEFIHQLQTIEDSYFRLLEYNWKPQEAAAILPKATKTELVMTGFIEDWIHFFDLRALGKTGKPHPQAEELAVPLMNEFKLLNLI